MPLELFPYQETGARFLAGRARAGLFDRPRVGKTAQLIRAMDLLGHSRGWLVVPAVARENWVREIRRFGIQPRRVCKGNTIHDFVAWQAGHYDTLVLSYEMAVRWSQYLHKECEPLDFMHFDEGHMLKNGDTNRAKALLGLESDGVGGALQWAMCSWWLTGTPVPNDPMDIYTFLKHQGVVDIPKAEFLKRFFYSRPTTYGSVQRAKADMLPELRQLIGNNSLTRSLEYVAPDLPPLMTTSYVVDGALEDVRALIRAHPGLDKQVLDALEKDDGFKGLNAPHIATLRRVIGEAKAVPYAHLILGELEGGLDKVVIFAHHKAALHTVQQVLWKAGIACGMITGDTSEKDRTQHQDNFARDPNCRVMLCNIRAAGVAINLTAAAAIDLLEVDWAPWMNFQALMRVYGQTQTRTVRARFISLANSFDEQVNNIIEAKTRACGDLNMADGLSIGDMLK